MRYYALLLFVVNIYAQYELGGVGLLPDIHCKEELAKDLFDIKNDHRKLYDKLMKWSRCKYSTSQHILALYSIVQGLKPQKIVEVGFGRSTFALIAAAKWTSAEVICCDRYDYSGYLERANIAVGLRVKFVVGDAKKLLQTNHLNNGVDFIFLDYFSSRERSADSIYKAINRFLPFMRQNGIIAVHDTIEKKYFVKDAFKKLRKDKNLEVMSLPYNYGLGLIRKLDKSEYGKIEDNWKKKDDK